MKPKFFLLVIIIITVTALCQAIPGDDVTTKSSTLTIGGRLQSQYQYVDSSPATNRLLLRRARLSFSSQLSEALSMKVQLEAGKQKFTLKDAYLGYKLKWFDIFVGQKHVPFSREALNSSKYLQMIERSISSQFAPFRQIGIGIHGFLMEKKIEYMAGIYDGNLSGSAVSKFADNKLGKVKFYTIDGAAATANNKYLCAGRLDIHPFGYMKKSQSYLEDQDQLLATIGINAFSSDDSPKNGHTPGQAELKKNTTYGGDLALKYMGFAATCEWIMRDISWWTPTNQIGEASQTTFTIQGGYMILAKQVELTARFEFLEYDKNGRLMGPLGQHKDSWTTVGLNYFFDTHHCKIQANYIIKKESMATEMIEPDNNTLLFQFAYYF